MNSRVNIKLTSEINRKLHAAAIRFIRGIHMRFRSKLSLLAMLVLFIIIGTGSGVTADNNSQISDLEDEISDNEAKYEEIQNQLDELEASKDDLEAYIAKMSKTYDTIEGVIDTLDSQISTKNSEIDEANTSIANLEVELAQQYEDMKMRIQFMYESNSMSYADVFLSSGSIAEMLERTEYIAKLMNYDREQMEAYARNLKIAEELKANLESEHARLLVLKEEQAEQIENLEMLMDNAKKNISEHQTQIAEAIEAAERIEEEIEAQRNTVEKLKEEEERRKREEEEKRQQQANGITPEKIPYQQLDGDIKRMAAIIWCEARGESYEGQLAVGTVVMNRVESPRFPNTIEGVISQKGQFSPYRSGKYALALSMENMQQSCIDAATEVIVNGVRTGDWLFFRMKNGIINGYILGNHVFY